MSDLAPARLADHRQPPNGDDGAALTPGSPRPRRRLLAQVEAELRTAVIDQLAAETQRRAASGSPAMTMFNRRQLAHATIVDLQAARFDAAAARGEQPLTLEEERLVRDNVLAAVFQRLPALEALLARSDVTDILFNGPDDVRVRTLEGDEERVGPIFATDRDMVAFLRSVARRGGHLVTGDDLFASFDDSGGGGGGGGIEQEFSETRPYLDLRLWPSGARLAAVGPWVTTTGTHISIRRHPLVDADQRTLVEERAMYSPELASLLGAAVRLGWRILLSGRPGAGKTTVLRALAHELAPSARIVLLEQNPELGLAQDPARHNHVVGLVERPANMEGAGAVNLDDHVRAVQRHLPDCLIVGEVRGAEVIGLLKALSMDIPGMSTIHARSTTSVFSRLVYYAQEADTTLDPQHVLRAAAEGLDLIVHLGRARDGRRVVVEVLHVGEFDESAGRPVTDQWYLPDREGCAVRNPKAPIPVDLLDDLVAQGYDPRLGAR